MDQKLLDKINKLCEKRFLTEEEFQKRMRPSKDMTYGEIREGIFNKEILPDVFIELDCNTAWQTFDFSNPKKTKSGFSIGFGKSIMPFDYFKEAYYETRTSLMDAIRDSYISTSNYKTVLILKNRALKNALVSWLIMRDKWGLVIADKFNIDRKIINEEGELLSVKTTGNIVAEERKKNINEKYSIKYKNILTKRNDYRLKYEKEDIFWNNNQYSLNDLANDMKHNDDILTDSVVKFMRKDLKLLDLDKFENLFYKQIFKKLLIAMNEFVEIANESIAIFNEHTENCSGKNSGKIDIHNFCE